MVEQLSARHRNLLAGRLSRDDVPDVTTNMIRMYFCSAGTDCLTERECFVRNVYPRLRTYCKHKYGLEFQVVDLNWGVPPDSMDNEADLTPVRIREIQKCQALSAGPDFMVFLGQKYGSRCLPDVMLPQDYQAILGALTSHKGRGTRKAPLLEQCYRLDENNIPAVYVLQHKTVLVPGLSDNNEEVRTSARRAWVELRTELGRLLQTGAELAYQDGKLDAESRERFFLSELENQIRLGLEGNDNPSSGCVLITRNIYDLHNYTHEPAASRFAEVTFSAKLDRWQLDPDSANMLVRLRNRLMGLLAEANTIRHSVLWRYEDVIDPVEHQEYLEDLCGQLYSTTRGLIDCGVRLPDNDIPRVCEEAAQHWTRCRSLASNFYNQETPLTKLREYITGALGTPLIVYGAAGTGKSKVISRLAFDMEDLVGDHVLLLRYLSATFYTTDIRQVLMSLCTQLAMVTGIHPGHPPPDMTDLVKYFTQLLAVTAASSRLVVILDGIDQLLPDHGAWALTWIPLQLPLNVKLILTVHDTAHGLLDRLRLELLPDSPESFLEISPVSVTGCEEIFNDMLLTMSRSLTAQQRAVFKDSIERQPLPLYVEMLVNIAKDVPSFADVDSSRLPSSCQDGIWQFLEQLEDKHGRLLVSRAFSYMVASSTGLSDCEMEDILSLDEDVLNEVFKDYHPPIRRLPCIKWLWLKQDAEAFLTHREADGVTVAAWKHDSFDNVVNTKYLSDCAVAALVHCNIADYFLGTWSDRAKPATLLDSDQQLSPSIDTNRQVPRQPHTYVQTQSQLVKFNKRMYEQVPRHLGLAGRYRELDALVYFNYEWLYNKIQALSLQSVLADLSLNPSEEARLVAQVLQMCQPVIETEVNNLPAVITGHLLPYLASHPNIRQLISQCDTDGLRHCALVPNFAYPHVPGTCLEFTLTSPTQVDQLLLLEEDKLLACKSQDDLYVHKFDLETGVHKTAVLASIGELYTTPNGKYFIIVDHITEKSIKIHEADSGRFMKQIIIMNHLEGKSALYKKGPLCVSDDRLCAIVTLSNSVLCVCEIPSGTVMNIIPLDGKCHVCSMAPGGSYVVCNSNSFLLAFDVYSHTHLLTTPLGNQPAQLVFSLDGLRAFISNSEDAKVTILHLSGETIDMSYRLAFDDSMPGDSICSLTTSPDDLYLLLRGKKHLVIYDRGSERVSAVFKKPESMPEDCKLPHSQRVELSFTQASFSADSRRLLATIFRSVYMWQLCDGSLVSVVQGPIGLMTSMLVSRSSSQVITHMASSSEIQVWRPGQAVQQAHTPDKLTDAVSEFHVTSDASLAFVKCCRSDAVGVINMHTGCMLDLLTHDTDVQDLAISPDGAWALVATSPRLKGTAFKLWNMDGRRVVMETGDVTGYCVGMHSSPCIIAVAQKSTSFRSPYRVSIIDLSQSNHRVREYSGTDVTVIRSKPFVTCSDQYLVIHSSLDCGSSEVTTSQPCLYIGHLGSEMSMSLWDAANMEFEEHLQDIVEVRPCRHNKGDLVAAIFSCVDHYRPNYSRDGGESGQTYGFFLLDVSVGSLTLLCIPFVKPSYGLDTQPLIFSPDFSLCLDDMSNIFHTPSGQFIGQVAGHMIPPRAFALGGAAVVYYRDRTLRVINVSDGRVMANCELNTTICQVQVCEDQRTLLVGGQDGTVLSYTILDPDSGRAAEIVADIPSRRAVSPEMAGRLSERSWDKSAQADSPAHAPTDNHRTPSPARDQPSPDVTQPSPDVTQPSPDVTQPSPDVTQPSSEVTQPSPPPSSIPSSHPN